MDIKEIEKSAKKIMDDFLEALRNIKDDADFSIDRKEFVREEGKANCDKDFRKRFFENAPKKNKNHILAEKGKWV